MERSRAKHLFIMKSSNISLVSQTLTLSDSAGLIALLSDGRRVILQLGGGLLDSLTKEVCMICRTAHESPINYAGDSGATPNMLANYGTEY